MNIVLSTLNAKYIHTNLAIRYLKAAARPEFDCELAEYTIKDPAFNIVSDLFQKKPDVVGFSCYIWNINETIAVIRMLKTVLPNVKIVLGGPEVSYDVHDWLRKHEEIDYIIMGEGEVSFKEMLRFFNGDIELEKVPGICYLEDGKIKIHAQPPKVDLREIASPFRFEEDLPHISKRIQYIETSRGCPFSCQFCLSSIEVGVRYFNREKVKEDIRYLMDNGAKTIKFVDRTFNISRSYAMEMFQFLIDERKPGVVFQFEITADIMRPEVIQFLNDNAPKGLFRFEIGVQSTNDLTNDLVKRRQNFEKLKRTVTMVKEGGKIDQHLDLIAGLPYENLESFKNSFNEVYAMKPDQFQLGFLKVLKGSYMAQKIADYHLKYTDTAPYEVLSTEWLSYGDCLKLKKIEEMVDLFYNSGQFSYTLPVLEKLFETPYEMYEELSTFFEKKGFFINNPARVYRYNLLLDFALEFAPDQAELFKELLTFDMYLRENCKTRPSFATDLKPYYGITKDIARQFSENHQVKTKDIAPAKEQCHVDLFSYSVWEADCPKSEEPQFVVFDYSNRNPLNHNASFFTCPAPSSSYEQPELQK